MKKLSILFHIFFLLLLKSCSDASYDDDTWIVGTSADNPPYEFIQNDKILGFDIDFITEIGKIFNKKLEFRNMEFYSLLAALSTNRINLVVAALSSTPERLLKVDFSLPYISSKIVILHKKDYSFTNLNDLKGKMVGAQLGTTWNSVANELGKIKGFTVTSLSNNLMLIEELKSKRIDALFIEEAQARRFINIYPDLVKFTLGNLRSSFAIAMPQNFFYKKDIDNAIKELKNNGTIEALAKKWGLIHASW